MTTAREIVEDMLEMAARFPEMNGPRPRPPSRMYPHTKRAGHRLTMSPRQVGDRDGWVCVWARIGECDAESPVIDSEARGHFGPSLEHLLPISKGGKNDPDNLGIAHWLCNVRHQDGAQLARRCKHGHFLTGRRKSGTRYCLVCHRKRSAAWHARRAATPLSTPRGRP